MSLAHAYMNKTCDSCKNYLSVKPLHRYGNGEIKCGRCVQPNDGGIAVWFTDIPDDTLFRCINHYEGCKKLLNHWEVAAHERSCMTSFDITCPLCSSNDRKYSSLQLLHHLKSDHGNSILNKPKFSITLSTRQEMNCFIYYTEEFVFVIYVFISPMTNSIVSIISILPSRIDFREIMAKMEVYSKEPKIEMHLDPLLNLESSKHFQILYSDVQKCQRIKFKFRIFVNTELFSLDNSVSCDIGHFFSKIAKFNTHNQKMELSGCRSVLTFTNGGIPSFCGLCKVLFYSKSIYKCETSNHFICSACRYFDIEKCEEGARFFEATAEHKILNEQNYECKWKCCSKDRFAFINAHEIRCQYQPTRKCPVFSCDHHGTLRQIFLHYKAEHSWHNIKMYEYWNEGSAVYVLDNIANNQQWHYYIITYDLFVTITCQEIGENYKFILDISERCDMNMKCCALIKYNGEMGYKVEHNFTIPKDKLAISKDGKIIYIRVFLSPAPERY